MIIIFINKLTYDVNVYKEMLKNIYYYLYVHFHMHLVLLIIKNKLDY